MQRKTQNLSEKASRDITSLLGDLPVARKLRASLKITSTALTQMYVSALGGASPISENAGLRDKERVLSKTQTRS